MKTSIGVLILATGFLFAEPAGSESQMDSIRRVPKTLDEVWLPEYGVDSIRDHIIFANSGSMMDHLDMAVVPVERYRFTWERSFDPKYSIYIYEAPAGNFVLRVTKYIGRRADLRRLTGDIDTVVSFEIKDIEALRALVNRTKFWEMTPDSNPAGLDGETWTFEGFAGGRYHAVTRWGSEDLESLGHWMIETATKAGAIAHNKDNKKQNKPEMATPRKPSD
jgi:hypothetical protein